MAAEKVTPEAVNFVTKYARGLLCLSMAPEKTEGLGLPMMVGHNGSRHETAFTVSIDAARGTTTGISAHDRAITILAAVDKTLLREISFPPACVSLESPKRAGSWSGPDRRKALWIWQDLQGSTPAGVVCQVMNDDGTTARFQDLMSMAEKHGLKICTIKDLIQYRMQTERHVWRGAETRMPTCFGGDFRLIVCTRITWTNCTTWPW